MKRMKRIAVWFSLLGGCGGAVGVTTDTGTPADLSSPASPDMMTGGGDMPAAAAMDLAGEIKGDTTLRAGTVYTLRSHVFVTAGTLTIEPGTLIKGDKGSSLVITQGAKIHAVGSAAAPIVFTSSKPAGTRKPGDWGGVVLLGRAPVNEKAQLKIEGFPDSEARTTYGGNDPAHDCGRLKYARIEFAGFELQPNKELNGLSVGACGSATELDFIQVHRGSDDGIEMFGGTTNLKHAVVTQVDDDGLDWDYGYTGKVQFLIVQQGLNAGDTGIEADNHPDPDHTPTPVSAPTIYNATLIGSGAAPQGMMGAAYKKQTGLLLRRGTAGRMFNFIVAHFADFPIDVTNPDTVARTRAPFADLFLKSSLFFKNGKQDAWDDAGDTKEGPGGFNEGQFFKGEGSNAALVDADPKLAAALHLTAPSFLPQKGSPALVAANAAVPPADGFFDASAKHLGALGEQDWTAGWTAFPVN